MRSVRLVQLGGVWLPAIVGLFRPLPMLPLLMFELVWKTIWLCAFGLPQCFSAASRPRLAST